MKFRIIEDGGPENLATLDYSYEYNAEYCSIEAAKKYLNKFGYVDSLSKIRVIQSFNDT
jgi:hypothetical protein